MSNQLDNQTQQFEVVTEIEASSNVIAEISDENLEGVTGGFIGKVYQAPKIVQKMAPVVMDKMSSYSKFFK
jgi:hypothetical protein